MAALQEPEVQFAQRLASNEKPVRTKAVKKLRKYINGRSQKAAGGFTGDELLKLWKGLFYCLWMQDKPLLQEELSNLISSLIHSFHSIDGQFLYLESFLQTFKREWTGIDRLRMDKFFQLVRFMFRQTFEMLKRKNWESSVVGRFLELLTTQLLQSGSEAPSGLRFHILDLYMTELALLGSAELTADQNLTFIEPFCKTAAKTKDRTLFRAICSSIFSTIIDQAPFAIDDLMKEMKAAEASDSDSGQASEEEEEEEEDEQKEKTKTSKPVGKKGPKKQINGHKSHDDDDDDDDDELLHLDDLDTELPGDSDVGPVLQFDYAALADKLFVLASRSSTPSHNRQRLYKIIKVLRDLSEGIFPQDEYPDEVSTDEDDEMFGSRKRMKRGGGFEEEEEGAPSAKKRKGKKKEASSLDQSKDSGQDTSEAADVKKKRRKKKKKKKKVGQAGSAAGEEKSEQEQPAALTQSTGKDTEAGSQAEDSETQISVSSVKVTEAAAPESQSETLLLVEVKTQAAVTVTDEDQSETLSKKKTKRETSVLEPEATEERQTPVTQEEEAAETSGKKKKKKKTGLKAESQVNAEAETTPETDAATLAKRNKMEDAGSQVTDADITPAGEEASQDVTTVPLKKKAKKKGLKMDQDEEETDKTRELSAAADPGAATPLKKKRKKSQKESEPAAPVEEADKLLHEMTTTTPAKKKKLAAEADGGVDMKAPPVDTEVGSSSGKLAKKKKKKIPVTFEFEADEVTAATSINGSAEEAAGVEDPSTPLSTKRPKKKTKASSGSDFVSFQSETTVPTPLFCRTKGSPSTPLSRKKKSQTPKSESKKVTFGLKNNKTAEFRKTDRSLLVSPDGSSRVPFDPQQKPKFGVLKSPPTLRSTSVKKTPNRKKSVATPKSTPKRRPSAADFF
ncbi:hypothetical protein PAMA_003608 [Pampus argenteus]